jgi:hypothetical protein
MAPKRKRAKRTNANEGGHSPPRDSSPSAACKRLEECNKSLLARVAELEAVLMKDKTSGEVLPFRTVLLFFAFTSLFPHFPYASPAVLNTSYLTRYMSSIAAKRLYHCSIDRFSPHVTAARGMHAYICILGHACHRTY